MFARMHVLETTSDQEEQGLEIVRDELLPWLRDSSGFRGLIRLSNRDEGRTLVITLWADEESLASSYEVGEQLSRMTAETSGAKRLAIEQYEATLFDVTA
jgi:heme-degrading monooxygenase HmoA